MLFKKPFYGGCGDMFQINPFLIRKITSLTMDEAVFRSIRQYRIFSDLLCGPGYLSNPDKVLTDNTTTSETYKQQWEQKKTFYFSPADYSGMQAVFGRLFPDRITSLVHTAETLLKGDLTVFGRPFSCPTGERWKIDPVTGHIWPDQHWSRLDVVNASGNIDPKYIWEINRHQFLIPAAMAFWFTREQSFADFTIKTLLDWIDHNPCGMGINWVESLEAATRLAAWVWILELLRGANTLTPDRLYRIIFCMAAHARHILRYLSCYISPNTHLTGEAWGLFIFSAVYPEMMHAQTWRRVSETLLNQEMMRQVGNDGVHRELSTGYHAYTADYFFQYLILNKIQGKECPEAFMARLEKMCDLILYCQRKDGTLPMLGDEDSGQALPLDPSGHSTARTILAHGALAFKSPSLKKTLDGLPWDAVWLWGSDAVNRFEQIPDGMEKDPCHFFQDANYMVTRTGWGEKDNVLVFDAGRMGFLNSGHSHADHLHFDLTISGRPVIVDIGTGSYHHPFWRNYCRGTAAHNTVIIDQQPQAEYGGKFNWKSLPEPGTGRLIQQSCFTLLSAEYITRQNLFHRRVLCQWEDLFYFCLDTMGSNSDEAHRYDFQYHFHPEISVDIAGSSICCRHQEDLLLTMIPMFPQTAAKQLFTADLTSGLGHYSPAYGQIVPTTSLKIHETITGSFSRGMLMLPGSFETGDKFISRRFQDHCFTVDFIRGQDTYRLVVSDTHGLLSRDGLDLACSCLLEKQTDQGVTNILALDVSSVTSPGKEIVTSPAAKPCAGSKQPQTFCHSANRAAALPYLNIVKGKKHMVIQSDIHENQVFFS
jgi:hypothetical protein